MAIKYELPREWIKYNFMEIANDLLEAKASVKALTNVPFQKKWAERLQQIQLKQEVAGTSRIEGAEFTERELDAALENETPEEALTRSQKQARAATNTYRWISALPATQPLTQEMIAEIHRRIVTGCDDDHCEPGVVRQDGNNVTFGAPRHRGAEGGAECAEALAQLCRAMAQEFNSHDVLVRGTALHYHIGAMHPFADGNGRTARALEALMLQRAGLRDETFISLSNYYYDEKSKYLQALADTRANNHDLTKFLIFSLRGITQQCNRLLTQINEEIRKSLYRDLMHELFNKLQSPKKRVLAKRQIAVLNLLLDNGPSDIAEIQRKLSFQYDQLKDSSGAFFRDASNLLAIKAVKIVSRTDRRQLPVLYADLSWPEKMNEAEFHHLTRMPSAKTYRWLQRSVAGEVEVPED